MRREHHMDGSEAVTISQLKTCVDEKLSGVTGGGVVN